MLQTADWNTIALIAIAGPVLLFFFAVWVYIIVSAAKERNWGWAFVSLWIIVTFAIFILTGMQWVASYGG